MQRLLESRFDRTTNAMAGLQPDPTTNNIRVKLPDKDDDDLSEVDNDAEKELE